MANTVLTTDTTPALDWVDIAGAAAYWIQIDDDIRFNAPTANDASLAASTYTPSALTTGKKYFWRTRGRTATAFTTDQSNTTGGGSGIVLRGAAAQTMLAQTFTPKYTIPVSQVRLSLKKIGTPTGNVYVEIWTTTSGSPTAQTGADSASVNAVSGLGTDYGLITFSFATPVILTAGTVYAIVLRGTFSVDGSHNVNWQHDGAGSYTGGAGFQADGSSVWTTAGTSDFIFYEEFNAWLDWGPVRSFWLDTAAYATYTPATWALIDVSEETDYWTFSTVPHHKATPFHISSGDSRNVAGDLLREYRTVRYQFELSWEECYLTAAQTDELIRFYNKQKSLYLVTYINRRGEFIENIYKVEFASEPNVQPIAIGREDLYSCSCELTEVGWT